MTEAYTGDYTCQCEDCITNSNNGCMNPQHCTLEAQKQIQKITLKLHPLQLHNPDNLTRASPPTSAAVRLEAIEEDGSNDEETLGIIFNPSVTIKSDLTDCFRIFVDPKKVMN